MISFKKLSQKKIKKTAYQKKSHIFKKRRRVLTTALRKRLFNPTYKFVQKNFLLQKKSAPLKKNPRILNRQP